MERMTRFEQRLAFNTLVSFAAARAGVTHCRHPPFPPPPPVPLQFEGVISGTMGVVLRGWLKWE